MIGLLLVALGATIVATAHLSLARSWRRAHDRLLVELQPHRDAADGEPSDGEPCLECEVRSLQRRRAADIEEAAATYEAMRARIRDLEERNLEAAKAVDLLECRVDALRFCANVGAFYDNEMDAAQADAFRAHLARCERCQERLVGLVQEHATLSTGQP